MRSENFIFALATIIGRSAAFVLRHYVSIITATGAASLIALFTWLYSYLFTSVVALSAGALTTLVLSVGGFVWYGLKQDLFKETNWGDDHARIGDH